MKFFHVSSTEGNGGHTRAYGGGGRNKALHGIKQDSLSDLNGEDTGIVEYSELLLPEGRGISALKGMLRTYWAPS